MGCDSIATTISGMGNEPTTLGPEDLKGHCFLTQNQVRSFFSRFGGIYSRNLEEMLVCLWLTARSGKFLFCAYPVFYLTVMPERVLHVNDHLAVAIRRGSDDCGSDVSSIDGSIHTEK